MRRFSIALVLALAIGLPGGWMLAMLLTPVLWRLEPVLHMELAGHSGPSDWVFYVVWLMLVPSLFALFWWMMAERKPTTEARIMKMKICAIAVLLFANVAFAQQTHNQYEPPNAPGSGQKLLAQFAGDWEVVKTFFPANGKPIVTKGSCKQYMIQDGKFLQSDFTFFNPDGTKSTGTGISGFDSKTNRFTTVWYDSRQTTMSIRQSDGTFDGKNIVLWDTPIDTEHPGRKTVARAHLEEDGRVLVHRHFLVDDKGNERMMIELRLTRKS